jgi:hypothetical protein
MKVSTLSTAILWCGTVRPCFQPCTVPCDSTYFLMVHTRPFQAHDIQYRYHNLVGIFLEPLSILTKYKTSVTPKIDNIFIFNIYVLTIFLYFVSTIFLTEI